MTNTVADQPAAVALQTTDLLLAWQAAQSPPTRSLPISGLAVYYLPLATGGTVSGPVTLSSSGAGINFTLNGAAGNAKQILFHTTSLSRWSEGSDSSSESGANAGSDYNLSRFSDAGALIDSPMTVSRATGVVTFADGIMITPGGLTVTGPVSMTGTVGIGTLELTSISGTIGGTLDLSGSLIVGGGALIAGGETVDILTVTQSETIGVSGTNVAINSGNVVATGSIQSGSGIVFGDSTDQLTAYGGAVAPSPSGLSIKVTSNSAITVTATALAVRNSGAQYKTLASFSNSIATGTSGAGGIDTGSIGASSWYNVFAINGASGTAAMLSLSATAPTMPSGYTFFSRLGAVLTDGSSHLLGTLQLGRRAQYVVGGSNVAALPSMISGSSGSPSAPTWTAVATGTFVPPTASVIHVVAFADDNLRAVIVAPNNSYGANGSTSNPPAMAVNTGSDARNGAAFGSLCLESANIYYASNGASTGMNCLGWEDNL